MGKQVWEDALVSLSCVVFEVPVQYPPRDV